MDRGRESSNYSSGYSHQVSDHHHHRSGRGGSSQSSSHKDWGYSKSYEGNYSTSQGNC